MGHFFLGGSQIHHGGVFSLCAGYCKDFADELKEYLRTDYVLVPVADGEFGKELPNKSWTGIIGELKRGVSSLPCHCIISLID